jgi:hypothetical protein
VNGRKPLVLNSKLSADDTFCRWSRRLSWCASLGVKRNEAAWQALVEVLQHDQDPNVRSEAANALASYGLERAWPLLKAVLGGQGNRPRGAFTYGWMETMRYESQRCTGWSSSPSTLSGKLAATINDRQ